MEKLNILFISFSIFWGSCHSCPQKETKSFDIINIDLSKDYPERKLNIHKIIDFEYVSLETNKDVLLSRYSILHHVSENYIFIRDIDNGNFFIFDHSGKIVSHFNHRGKGPGEYGSLSCVIFDEKNKEIFAFDYTNSILVYSLTGEYKRTLKYSTDLELRTAYDFDDESLLVCDTKGMYYNTYNKKPYMFISKKDGRITSVLNINFQARYNTKVVDRFKDSSGQEYFTNQSISVPNRNKFGQYLMISDLSSDTIYRLTKDKDLIPFIVRAPSVHSSEAHIICVPILITDKYIILYKTVLDHAAILKSKTYPSYTLMYEFETKELYEINYNIDYRCKGVNILLNNTDVSMTDTDDLISSYKRNKLRKDLIPWVANLDEEDNPVVVIKKYK